MVNNEPLTRDMPSDPDQTSSPLKKSASQENPRFRQRDLERRTSGSDTAPGKDTDLKEKGSGSEEEEETDPERSSSQQRHHRGGRPEKRIIEESAHDPYCE
jgi:hypothetical protein